MFDDPGRRQFLKLMGASLLLGGLTACNEQTRSDQALPYVNQPDPIVPGVARYYATAVLFEGYAQPVIATTYAGRPTKLDGNPDHPATGGASDAFMQSAIFGLYDPERSKIPVRDGAPSTWGTFGNELLRLRAQLARTAGRRSAHPHRRHLIADPDPPDAGAGQAISENALAPVRAGRHGGAGPGDGARLSAARPRRMSGSTGATSSSASITICSGQGRIRSPMPRLGPSGAARSLRARAARDCMSRNACRASPAPWRRPACPAMPRGCRCWRRRSARSSRLRASPCRSFASRNANGSIAPSASFAPTRAVRCSRSGRGSIRNGRRWRRSSMTSSATPARRSGPASRSWRQAIRPSR